MRFVCQLFRGKDFWKATARYDERHVIVLASMLYRHGGHSLTCIQDGSFSIPPGITSITMPEHVAALPDYQPKLWVWSRQLHDLIGERFAVIDLDVVIAGDLAPVLARSERFCIWDHAAGELYNSSLFVISPGFGNAVWDCYSVNTFARVRHDYENSGRYWTGDQSWIGHVLGRGKTTFGECDGVIQYRPKYHRAVMPSDMLACFMCGPYEPFSEAEESEWVKTLYH